MVTHKMWYINLSSIMIKACSEHKKLVVDILTKSFVHNKSVNYVVKQDSKRISRIKGLMEYCFNICSESGSIYLSENKKTCALILYPDCKKYNLFNLIWDIKLAYKTIGICRIYKILKREAAIKKYYPGKEIMHLWFIGVAPDEQKQGNGTLLLQEIINDARERKRPIYLETSTEINIGWYKKNGFDLYKEINLGYPLFLFKKEFCQE